MTDPHADMIRDEMTRMVRWYGAHGGRSAQTELGPSDVGHPCDRHLAYALAGAAPRSTGGDPLPALVGTGAHHGLERAARSWGGQDPDDPSPTGPYTDNPRYIVESRVTVPGLARGGRVDLYDTWTDTVIDHKFMGGWSMSRFLTDRATEQQRAQAHVYAYGWHSTHGVRPERVAWVAWPKEKSDRYNLRVELDYMAVQTEPYDPALAVGALERAAALADRAAPLDLDADPMAAEQFDTDPSACRFCPWFVRNSINLRHGCPGY